ncbi:DUF2441 domain-containing protein [Fusobacterium perfoetens]|uniref:DUF2441 domain-containing protein n=1 Tax=Fusobacterium perfoetens TaxID=852 RepID=UPI001F205B9F|nr:hypothetical protein [Fusobacterium perfoetens]
MIKIKILNQDEEMQSFYYIHIHDEMKNIRNIDTSLNKEIRINSCLELSRLQNDLYNNKILPKFIHNNLLAIEANIEFIRQAYYKDYPSRFSCIFAVADLETLNLIKIKYNWNSPIKKIIPSPEAKIIKCDMNWIDFLRTAPPYNQDHYIYYLAGIDFKEAFPKLNIIPIYEYLIEGYCEIVDV